MRIGSSPRRRVVAVALLVLAFPFIVRANHGPGASGGGSATISGETLKPGAVEIEVREDYSQFEHFGRNEAVTRAIEGGGSFDALDHGFLTTVGASVGVVESFQIGANLG